MRFNARHLLLLVILLWEVGYIHGQTMTGATTSTVKLGWTAPPACTSTNPCSYIPFRLQGTCPATVIGSVGWLQLPQTGLQTGSTLDSPSGGQTYSYVVKTVQGAAQSDPSNCVSVVVPLAPSPAGGLNVAIQ